MSHFSRIKTQMVEKEFLIAALKDMGYPVRDETHEIHSFGGRSAQVDLSISLKFGAQIGFRQTAEHYEIIGDWWGALGTKQKEFTDHLMQRYAYHASRAKLEEQGFTLISEEVENTGQIRLVLRRMA